MAKTMKAVLKKDLNPGISVEEVPIPEINDNQVLLKVRAAGICGSDVHMYEGDDSYKVFESYMPFIIGHEFSGEVAEVGKNIKNLKPGDRVVSRVAPSCGTCHYCMAGKHHFCSTAFQEIIGLQIDGGFAEYIAVREEHCIPLPDSISFELGALIEPLGVGANAVNDSRLALGETVVIQGPGPIGLFILLFAKARGAGKTIVIGTKKDKARLEKAKEFDADHIIYADDVDVVKEVQNLTNGRGADVVFESSGIPSLIQTAANMADKTGRIVTAGIYGAPASIDFTPVVRSAKQLIGTYGGPIAWDRLVEWLGSKSYYATLPEAVITHRCSLEDADAAFQRSIRKESIKELFIMD